MGIRGSLLEGRVQPGPPPEQRAEHCPLLRDEKTTAAHPLTNNLSCTHSNLKAQCSARDQMALNVEGAIDRCMCGEESLRRTGGIEALHPSFSLPYRQMRILGPIVDPSAGDVAAFMARSLCAAPYDGSLSVTTASGENPCDVSSLRISFKAACFLRCDCTRTSRTSASKSTARHRQTLLPLTETKTSARCQRTSARVCARLSFLA